MQLGNDTLLFGFCGAGPLLAFLASGCLSVSDSEPDAPEMALLELVSSSEIVSLLFGITESDFPLLTPADFAFLTFSTFAYTTNQNKYDVRSKFDCTCCTIHSTTSSTLSACSLLRWHVLDLLAVRLHLLLVALLVLLLLLFPRHFLSG